MEVKAQPDHLTEKQPTLTSTSTNNTESSSESTSSESTSSESNQTNETSEESDSSSEESKSLEDSNASDSDELQQIKAPDCVKGTQSCESEEYFFQDIGDDAQYSVDNLMMPEEAERELRLRRWGDAFVQLFVLPLWTTAQLNGLPEDFRMIHFNLAHRFEC